MCHREKGGVRNVDFNSIAKNERPGYHLIFRKSRTLKNGQRIYAKKGHAFPMWVKD